MKKILISIFTVLLTVLLLAGAGVGIWAYKKFAPSKIMTDQKEWFGVSGTQVAIFLDNERMQELGKLVNGHIYLSIDWVNENLNERFYWSQEDEQLIYTLPESIIYADADTQSGDGSALFVQEDGQVFLLLDLVKTYTDIRVEAHIRDEVKRVYIDTAWEPLQQASVKKNGELRTHGGVKSEILEDVNAGASVTILEQMENWSEVRTESGYIGYIPNKLLKDVRSIEQISLFEAPIYENISMNEPVQLVWHQVTSNAANAAMETMISQTKGVNVIAPTWFMLTDNEGNFDSLASENYVKKAHELGLQVWATLDNFNRGENVQSEVLFASTKARKKLIASLMETIEKYEIDGINIDIEGIKPSAGVHYIQFIRELSVSCRKAGTVLSVDTYVPSSYTAFYNRAEQGRVADYVVIMGYDEHYAGGESGSVASIGYERKGIEDTLKAVPAEKIISGIPLYTRLWKTENEKTTSQAMGLSAAEEWVKKNQVELFWQEELGQFYGEKAMDGILYEIWMEDERSIGEKAALIKEYKLAGIACWKLGFDTADIWNVIQQ